MEEKTELMTVDSIRNRVYIIQLKKDEVPEEFSKSQIVILNEQQSIFIMRAFR